METAGGDLRVVGLPVAAPLEEGATADSQGNVNAKKTRSNRKRNMIVVFLVATVTIAVILGILLTREPDEVTSPATEQESTGPDLEESPQNVTEEEEEEVTVAVKQEVDADLIKDLVEEAYVSPRVLMEDPSTPQYQAIEWLTESDEFFSSLSDDESFQSKVVQRYIVVLFYYSLDGPGWDNQVRALSPDLDECEWNMFLSEGESLGFLCNDNGQVNHISLWWNNLAGSLPNEVGNLTMLSSFNIIGGSISGTIPASLSQCKDMRALGLGHHQLEGEIPDSFATMDKLSFAFFYLNQNLTGFNKLCHLLYDGVLAGLAANCNPTNPVECECCTDCCDESLPGKETCCFTKYKEEKGFGTEGWCYDPTPWLE